MDLDEEPASRVWAYRKAAWAIEDLDADLGLVYRAMRKRGLEGSPGVGPSLAAEVERTLQEISTTAG